MRIGDILKAKGSAVHATHPWATVADVVVRLEEHGVGALLVRDEAGAVRGIVSERDVVRGLRRHGAEVLAMTAADIMTHHVVTAGAAENVGTAMARMTRGRHRHLPVVDGGAVIGMVSIGDLVKHRVQEMELETGVLRDAFIARS